MKLILLGYNLQICMSYVVGNTDPPKADNEVGSYVMTGIGSGTEYFMVGSSERSFPPLCSKREGKIYEMNLKLNTIRRKLAISYSDGNGVGKSVGSLKYKSTTRA